MLSSTNFIAEQVEALKNLNMKIDEILSVSESKAGFKGPTAIQMILNLTMNEVS